MACGVSAKTWPQNPAGILKLILRRPPSSRLAGLRSSARIVWSRTGRSPCPLVLRRQAARHPLFVARRV